MLHAEGTLRETRPDVCRPEVNIIPVGASSSPRNATMRRLCAFHSPAGGFAFENSFGDAVEGETTHRSQNYSRRRWRRIRRREQAIFRIFRYAEKAEEKLLALLSRRLLRFFSRNGSLEDHDYRCFSSSSYRSFISSPTLLKRGFARSPPSWLAIVTGRLWWQLRSRIRIVSFAFLSVFFVWLVFLLTLFLRITWLAFLLLFQMNDLIERPAL